MEKIAQVKSPTFYCASDWYVYFHTVPGLLWDKSYVLVHMDAGFGVKKKVKNRAAAIKIHEQITTLAEKEAVLQYKKLGWKFWHYFDEMSPYKSGYKPSGINHA